MKQFTAVMALTLAGSVLLSGCGQKEQAPPPTPTPPPTTTAPAKPTPPPTPTTPAVPAAAPSTSMVDLVASAKDGVSQAMTLASQGKYTEALTLLQQKATEVQSNPDAMKLINDAIAQVKKMAADAATKAATDKVGGLLGGTGK